MDDTILISLSKAEVTTAVNTTRELLIRLGFKLNEEKSVLLPKQELLFLGFNIYTLMVKVSVSTAKCTELTSLIQETLDNNRLKVWDLATLTGKLVATDRGINGQK